MEEHELPEDRRDRPRSNTWPLPEPPSLPTEPVKSAELPEQISSANLAKTLLNDGPKKSSRKNAWGNLSYADLITQAIQSSPEKRLTLAEIYEWMVQTIPYFKDKGDSNSSAGWKVCMYSVLWTSSFDSSKLTFVLFCCDTDYNLSRRIVLQAIYFFL